MRTLSTREKFFVAIFMVALIWGVWNYRHLLWNSAPSAHVEHPAMQVAVTTVIPNEDVKPALAMAKSGSVPEWGPDPFQRAWRISGSSAAAPSSAKSRVSGTRLKLSAIVDRPDGRYAVINGGIVREGGMVAGRRVVKIERSSVVVDVNGTEVTLSL